MSIVNQYFDGTINFLHPIALATKNATNDTFTVKQMFQQEDSLDFVEAMMKEVSVHESRNHWSLIRCSSLPPDIKKIMSIWSFKRKRFPDVCLMKHKERLCTHGG